MPASPVILWHFLEPHPPQSNRIRKPEGGGQESLNGPEVILMYVSMGKSLVYEFPCPSASWWFLPVRGLAKDGERKKVKARYVFTVSYLTENLILQLIVPAPVSSPSQAAFSLSDSIGYNCSLFPSLLVLGVDIGASITRLGVHSSCCSFSVASLHLCK